MQLAIRYSRAQEEDPATGVVPGASPLSGVRAMADMPARRRMELASRSGGRARARGHGAMGPGRPRRPVCAGKLHRPRSRAGRPGGHRLLGNSPGRATARGRALSGRPGRPAAPPERPRADRPLGVRAGHSQSVPDSGPRRAPEPGGEPSGARPSAAASRLCASRGGLALVVTS